MLRLKKYIQPYISIIGIVIVMLFVSNVCDLKLPDIMSNIVNIGIQQSGIEHASCDEISQDGLDFLKVFMDEDEIKIIDNSYALENKTYVLKEDVDREELDDIFSLSEWTFINTLQQMNPDNSTNQNNSLEEVDLSQIYAMKEMFQMMDLSEAKASARALDESMRNSTGVVFAKMFYEEIDINTSQIQTNYIIKCGLKMLGVALLGICATIIVSFISSRISNGIARDLRKAVFEKVESFSNNEFDQFSTSSLITRTTNDVTQVSSVIMMGIRTIISAPIMGIGALWMIFKRNTSMVWVLGLGIVIVMIMIIIMFIFALPKFKIIQKYIDRINLVARENLSGLLVVRAFKNQEFEKERFDQANQDLTKTQLFVNRMMSIMMPFMTLMMNCMMILIIWVGAHQIAQSQMQVGDMMAFMQYSMQVIMSFMMIAMIFIMVPRASVSAGRISDVLETKQSILDPLKPLDFDEEKKGIVEFKNVSFKYGDAEEYVLENISFVAKPHETTAFIGSTGSGKSTLINLIPRFYDVNKGEIIVSGRNIKDVSQHDLHDQIGYVAQKGILLSGTILDNIKYGNESLSDEEVDGIAQVAQAKDFIVAKEEGYQFNIAQEGSNVSGGQKQRLSIARALAKKAPILIFDDSFSALDFKTDAALRKALHEYSADATVLIVAQRVSSIMNADQIIVLDEGKIVGKGKHEELLKTCPTYYEIASSQLAKEEL
ncbi:MAG: ABC transporter ATP-binding protein [Traorella sp.]